MSEGTPPLGMRLQGGKRPTSMGRGVPPQILGVSLEPPYLQVLRPALPHPRPPTQTQGSWMEPQAG